MKKGFTLIELLGVIVILAILTTIIVPVATTLISKSTSQLDQVQLKNIQTGAMSWATDNINSVPGDNSSFMGVQVSLDTLISGGYIPSDIKDLTTKSSYSGKVYVVIIYDNKRLVYDVYNDTTLMLFDSNHTSKYSYVAIKSSGTYACYRCDSTGTATKKVAVPYGNYDSTSKSCVYDTNSILNVAD